MEPSLLYLREIWTVCRKVEKHLTGVKMCFLREMQTVCYCCFYVCEQKQQWSSILWIHQQISISCFFFSPSILNTDNEHLTFRGNSIATKAMEAYMKLVGEKVSILLYFICFFEQQLFVITFILLYLFVHIICNVPISETWSW